MQDNTIEKNINNTPLKVPSLEGLINAPMKKKKNFKINVFTHIRQPDFTKTL